MAEKFRKCIFQGARDENVRNISSESRKLKHKIPIILPVILILVFGILAAYRMYVMSFNQLAYVVKRNSADIKYLDVEVCVKNLHGFPDNKLKFYKAAVNTLINYCWDEKDGMVNFSETDEFIEIDVNGKRDVRFNYTVKVGDLGRHGHQGQSYDDMLVFIGDQVAMIPYEAFNDTKSEHYGQCRQIKRISLSVDVPRDWTAIVPFANTAKKSNNDWIISIKSPTWREYYALMKGCYAFGNFEKYGPQDSNVGLTVYVDKKAKQYYTDEAKQGIGAIYDYFTHLFNGNRPNLAFVILRGDPDDKVYIMGGLSTETLGSTFVPKRARDWELLAHRMFHAFFDSQVTSSKYAIVPQNWYYDGIESAQGWFYEGIVTYYEYMAMDSLPETLKTKLQLGSLQGLKGRFKQYAYLRLKDPSAYSVIPLKEHENTQYKGKIEFLHYVQAPLLVKTIQDMAQSLHGREGVLLEYVLENPSRKGLTINNVIQYVLGDKADEFTNKYLYGSDVLPLWSLADMAEENSDEIISELNSYEELFEPWMKSDYPQYTKDILSVEGLVELSAEADRQKLNFESEDVEQCIKKISPTIYHLLKQYALRAKICGAELGTPSTRAKLLADDVNIAKWKAYKETLLKNIQQ